ncbi:MAG: FkbM family methyltransferase [Saprospiraceae bacterium]|nr:FkbM family methyltransferase [Saprospiraceae bacterium]
MKAIIARIKNLNQQLRQRISFFFPGYIKRSYFREIDAAMLAKPLKISRIESEILFIADLIPSEAVCIDIGANRGDYVYALERSNKPKSLYALEPIPELNHQLKNLFPHVHVCREAASDESGIRHFNIPYIQERYFDTRGTLEPFQEQGQTSTRSIPVETITLDEFIKKYKIHQVDLIKMDIEGHEYAALKGATSTLDNLRPVWMIEIEQRHHPAYRIEMIFAFIQQYAYQGYFFDGSKQTFQKIESFSTEAFQNVANMNDKTKYINNFFFIPTEKVGDYLSLFNTISKRFG